MGTIVVANAVVREPGYLYYISKEGDLCKALMSHTGKKKKIKGTRGRKKKIIVRQV